MPAWFRTFQKNLTKYNQNHIYSTRICCLLSKVWNLQTFYCFISFPVGPRSEVLRGARYRPRPQYYRPRPALVLQSNNTNKQFCTAARGWDQQDEKCFVLCLGTQIERTRSNPSLHPTWSWGATPLMATAPDVAILQCLMLFYCIPSLLCTGSHL